MSPLITDHYDIVFLNHAVGPVRAAAVRRGGRRVLPGAARRRRARRRRHDRRRPSAASSTAASPRAASTSPTCRTTPPARPSRTSSWCASTSAPTSSRCTGRATGRSSCRPMRPPIPIGSRPSSSTVSSTSRSIPASGTTRRLGVRRRARAHVPGVRGRRLVRRRCRHRRPGRRLRRARRPAGRRPDAYEMPLPDGSTETRELTATDLSVAAGGNVGSFSGRMQLLRVVNAALNGNVVPLARMALQYVYLDPETLDVVPDPSWSDALVLRGRVPGLLLLRRARITARATRRLARRPRGRGQRRAAARRRRARRHAVSVLAVAARRRRTSRTDHRPAVHHVRAHRRHRSGDPDGQRAPRATSGSTTPTSSCCRTART